MRPARMLLLAAGAPMVTTENADPWDLGLPPQPVAMQSWWLYRSIAAFFVANSTGLANRSELVAQAFISTRREDLEEYEIRQAAALKQAR